MTKPVALLLALWALLLPPTAPRTAAAAPTVAEVLESYADIAHAAYRDSLISAKTLRAAVARLLAEPSPESMIAARAAWLAARVPYQQTEVFRFGNAVVDDWEGKVNAWPLDEGLIDYVAGDYGAESDQNELYAANVIANRSLRFGGGTVDASEIDKALISETLHEAGGVEANVATGYHAIEFLLWGQDLNGTGPGAGARPASDYDLATCTGGNCARRAAYLSVVTDLLIEDLEWMVAQWAPKGAAREALLAGDATAGLTAIFTGLGSLAYGELAGERMKLGLLIHDPEEEHDCFSDNTHNSHYYDALGMRNVYLGRYRRIDGSLVAGPSPSDLVRARSAKADAALRQRLDASLDAMAALVRRAETFEAYDQMISEGNAAGNAVVQAAIDALLAQTRALERAVATLELSSIALEGSDSLDASGKAK